MKIPLEESFVDQELRDVRLGEAEPRRRDSSKQDENHPPAIRNQEACDALVFREQNAGLDRALQVTAPLRDRLSARSQLVWSTWGCPERRTRYAYQLRIRVLLLYVIRWPKVR